MLHVGDRLTTKPLRDEASSNCGGPNCRRDEAVDDYRCQGTMNFSTGAGGHSHRDEACARDQGGH